MLYERLHEVDSKKMVQQMENNLQMLESNMDNVLKTAEMLGAAHQVPYKIKHLKPEMSHHRHCTEPLNNNHALFMFCMHQEARVSNAVELMSVHMEHLKTRHAIDSEEMLEVRKLLHRRKGRLHSDSTGQCCP